MKKEEIDKELTNEQVNESTEESLEAQETTPQDGAEAPVEESEESKV